ncbi:TetR/AcrR family transcriptional regulator [Streptomyces buecherae]|uniref:TetR/AcrR family transcriptional regulator n=1 Tax=Streptomyces buecherae TaxID=2763006 RepID=UPI0036A9AD80
MTATSSAKVSQPRLRADALRNRERIIAAAREVFVEHGADVPLDEIARRAGVGNATLYRHFADRGELIHHVALSVMDHIADQAEAARVEEPDAFEALRRFVHQAAGMGALCPLMSHTADKEHPELVAARHRLNRGIEALMRDARESGQLRTDIDVGDLMVAVTQLTRPLPGLGATPRGRGSECGVTCVDFDQFVHRHLQLFLDGLATPARSVLPGAAATMEDLRPTT